MKPRQPAEDVWCQCLSMGPLDGCSVAALTTSASDCDRRTAHANQHCIVSFTVGRGRVMALIADTGLPAFDAMRIEGVPVATVDEARGSGLPHISIGFLNLMPDTALKATDRQFLRLASAVADSADIWFRPFTFAVEQRGVEARHHIDQYYVSSAVIADAGVDALIITGANPVRSELSEEVFWGGLAATLDWARHNQIPAVCSCLATHAGLEHLWGVARQLLPAKCWGVFDHEVVEQHPLLEGVVGPVVAPHSHRYEVSSHQIESIGAQVLLNSPEAGVHMAVSEDEQLVFFQGHPEYDQVSLLKEYQREVGRYYRGERAEYPPTPDNYLAPRDQMVVDDHRLFVEAARRVVTEEPSFPEHRIGTRSDEDWFTPGRTIFRNWLSGIAETKDANPVLRVREQLNAHLSRRSADRACASRPSSRANCPTSVVMAEGSWTWSQVGDRRKVSGDSPDWNRAVPPVGRTWLGPIP